MLEQSRNLCLYPNVYLMDQFSSQIRCVRPISVDKTEVTIYCIAPKGEADEARARRMRQYEDFFNATRHGHAGRPGGVPLLPGGYAAPRGGMERHEPRRDALDQTGPRCGADLIGLKPELSGIKTEDEGLYIGAARLLAGRP